MASTAQQQPQPSTSSVYVPWWVRATRWRPTSRAEGISSEANLYKRFVRPSVQLQVSDVRIGEDREAFLHTVSGGPAVQPPVVFMPGYGAGVGFFYRNFEGLCSKLRLLCVDWLGTGLSGRPPYKARTREESEKFFLESLTAWHKAQGLGKMILVGHSLGGYLAASYALQHPEQVQHLVLVCPAGVPKAPEDWESRFLGRGWSFRGQMFKTFMWLWEKGVTPGGFVRMLGPWGPGLVHRYVGGRFQHHGEGLTPDEIDTFQHYFYHIAAAPGSGEYALRHLLAPGAYAHAPLEERLHELKVPVTFIYGEHDWMRPEHAVKLCKKLRSERAPRAAHDLSVEIIQDAGHFVFMDQPELFNKALASVVAPYLEPDSAVQAATRQYSADHTTTTMAAGGAEVNWGFAANGNGMATTGMAAPASKSNGASAPAADGEDEADDDDPEVAVASPTTGVRV